jgi:hypothetical protein
MVAAIRAYRVGQTRRQARRGVDAQRRVRVENGDDADARQESDARRDRRASWLSRDFQIAYRV